MRGACVLLMLVCAQPAAAQNYVGCSDERRGLATAAIRNAKALSLSAAVNIGDTEIYARWFGKYSSRSSERVRANFKSVFTAIRSGRVTATCEPVSRDGCKDGTYAWVFDNKPYLIHLCPPFFDLPTMAELNPFTHDGENGTREGTIIHEISHFRNVARTEDNCYSRDVCSEMAQNDVEAAIENADSYQYFAEDVRFYGRAADIVGKPAATPNVDP